VVSVRPAADEPCDSTPANLPTAPGRCPNPPPARAGRSLLETTLDARAANASHLRPHPPFPQATSPPAAHVLHACRKDTVDSAGGRLVARKRPRPWRPTSCRSFFRPAIPRRPRRRFPGGRSAQSIDAGHGRVRIDLAHLGSLCYALSAMSPWPKVRASRGPGNPERRGFHPLPSRV
jgi:hypothetical protein